MQCNVMFHLVGPKFEQGAEGLRKFRPETERFLDLAVAKSLQSTRTVTDAADDADDV